MDKIFLEKIVEESKSLNDILRKLNKSSSDSSIKWLKNLLCEYDIDFQSSIKHSMKEKMDLKDALVENSPYKTSYNLLKRLVEEGYKKYECECCGIDSWNGKEISLQLHHINGNHSDNRIENLQVLCPNCHSQTENFGNKKEKNKCLDCGAEILRKSTYCKKCAPKHNLKNKGKCPSKVILEDLIFNETFTEIGKKYGVSDKAVSKWCVKYGLPSTKKEIKKMQK